MRGGASPPAAERGRSAMEYYAIFAAALASSAAGAERLFLVLLAGLALYAGLLAAVIREFRALDRRIERWAALEERRHQEYIIFLKMDARRRREDHEKFMKRLNARRR